MKGIMAPLKIRYLKVILSGYDMFLITVKAFIALFIMHWKCIQENDEGNTSNKVF